MIGIESLEITPTSDNPFSRVRVRDSIVWGLGLSLLGPLIIMAVDNSVGGFIVTGDYLTISMYCGYLGSICWVLLQRHRAGIELDRVMGRRPERFGFGRLVPLVLALLVLSIFGTLILGGIALLLDLTPPWELGKETELLLGESSVLHRLIMLLILAPTLEEILFRGYFLHRFSEKWSPRTAIWVSSVMFALCHTDFLGTFAFALVASCLYLRTRSLLVPMALHAFYNSVPAFFLVLGEIIRILMPDTGGMAEPSTVEALDPDTMIAVAGCLGVIGLLVLIPTMIFVTRFLKDNWPEAGTELPYFASPDDTDTEVFWRRRRMR